MKNASRGFTLLETVIVVGLAAFTLLAVVNFYLNFNSVLGTDGALMNVSKDSGRVINETEAVLLPATHVLASYAFGGTTYSSDSDTLVLELPSLNSSGIQIAGKYDYVVLYLDGATAYLRTLSDAASSRPSKTLQLATTVDALTLTYDNADFTQVRKTAIDIQTSVTVKGETISSHLYQQVFLRNF